MEFKEKKKLAFEWFSLTDGEKFKVGLPLDKKGLARKLKIGLTTVKDWESRYYAEKIGEEVHRAEEVEVKKKEKRKKGVDAKEWVNERLLELLEATLESAKGVDGKVGNAASQKLLAQLAEILIEKQETTVKLDGAVLIAAINEVERERGNQRGMAVQDRLSPLPPELRLDSGQGSTQDD